MKATDRYPCTARRLAAVLAAWLIGATASLAQPAAVLPTVADVIPVGNVQVPTQRIKTTLKTHPGQEYSQAVVDEDVRELYKNPAIKEVQVKLAEAGPGKVVVYFQVTEHPNRIQEVLYPGAKHISKDDLEGITGLRAGMVLNPVAVQVARQSILRKYTQEKGRLFTSVEILEGDKPNDTRVVFAVTEGDVVRVSDIAFTGVAFVAEGRLRTLLVSSRTFLGIGGEYNQMMVEADIGKLVEYYKSYGFHDVRVSRELIWEENASRAKLVFHVQEGRRYRFGDVQVDGPRHLPQDQLISLCAAREGNFYSENEVKRDQEIFKTMRGWEGINAVVNRDLTFKENGEVNVRYEVVERPPHTVGQVIVVGNTTTKMNVILRQVPLYPGQILSYPDLRVAERNLARLNIFEADGDKGTRPTLEVLDPDGPNPVKDILVNVQETRTGSLLLGVGVNSDAGLSGSIVLNERNFDILRPPTSLDDLLSGRAFRGAGQEFRLEAVPGTRVQRYTASWREPFFLDTPFSLGISAYYYTRAYNEYDESRLGTRVTVGRRLNDYWTVTGGLRVENVRVDNIPFFAPPQITDAAGDNSLLGLRVGLTRDSRDSFLRPTEGSMVELGAEQCLGTFDFPVLTAEANKFWTVYQRADGSGRWVVAGRSQVGWAGDDTPVFERFYAGGFRSMRGFEFRGVGPNVNGFMVGGTFQWLNSLELQVPLLANDQLYAVTFVDSGTVDSSTSLDNYRVTAGAGLRIVVPMLGPVPIALDFGFPVVKADTDRKQVFSFWVGFFN